MKEKFNLIQAMTYLKEGKKVRMITWFSDVYIYEGDNGIIYINHHARGNRNLVFGLNKITLTRNIWEVYEEQRPILDTEEKAYLEAVLRPFKDRFVYLTKTFFLNSEYIEIVLKDVANISEWVSLNLPRFKPNAMYKGMELHKKYTLEELGLFDRKIY